MSDALPRSALQEVAAVALKAGVVDFDVEFVVSLLLYRAELRLAGFKASPSVPATDPLITAVCRTAAEICQEARSLPVKRCQSCGERYICSCGVDCCPRPLET